MGNAKEIDSVLSRLETAAEKIESSLAADHQKKAERYRRELKNVVEVLEQTKGAFRSKQLKNLRERIEDVLQQEIH
ncbi:MAG: hypothetical protein JXR73_02810 [Candidatus Omnitrophica bacterium]|nr:hypothetical protein [Candidatus Omnitrophota bacterium]